LTPFTHRNDEKRQNSATRSDNDTCEYTKNKPGSLPILHNPDRNELWHSHCSILDQHQHSCQEDAMETTEIRRRPRYNPALIPGSRSSFLTMVEGARTHLRLAKEAVNTKNTADEADHTAKLITSITNLMNMTRDDASSDMTGLFSYMIDRLTIKHSRIDIHPVVEVGWLLDNIQNILENTGTYQKH
jgi:flagellin-specific chaperone FliS